MLNCSTLLQTTGGTVFGKLDNKKYTEDNYTKGEQYEYQNPQRRTNFDAGARLHLANLVHSEILKQKEALFRSDIF